MSAAVYRVDRLSERAVAREVLRDTEVGLVERVEDRRQRVLGNRRFVHMSALSSRTIQDEDRRYERRIPTPVRATPISTGCIPSLFVSNSSSYQRLISLAL